MSKSDRVHPWWRRLVATLVPTPPDGAERLDMWHFWLLLLGFDVAFFPMHFLGVIGMPRGICAYIHMPRPSVWPILLAGSLLVMVGAALIGIGPIVIGGVLTLYCIARFELEYHRRPSAYEIVLPPVPGAGVRGKEE